MSRWTCAGCRVEVRYLNGHEPPTDLPEGWQREGGELRCLACRRQAAVDAALAEAESDERKRTISMVRRRALIIFELKRDASRPNAVIAKPVGTTPTQIATVRAELIEAGVIPRRKPGRPRKPKPRKPKPRARRATPAPVSRRNAAPQERRPPKPRSEYRLAPQVAAVRARIEAVLLADPLASNRGVARRADSTYITVRKHRARLEAAGTIPRTRMEGHRRVAA